MNREPPPTKTKPTGRLTFGLHPVPWIALTMVVILSLGQCFQNWYVENRLGAIESAVHKLVFTNVIESAGESFTAGWKGARKVYQKDAIDLHDSTHEAMFKNGVVWGWIAQFNPPTNVGNFKELGDYFWAKQIEAERKMKP